jgi:methionyl-tRNA formyltransferase
MKIGYFADGPWSYATIKLLSKMSGVRILFIVPRFDTQDPILKQWAQDLNIPFIVSENVNDVEFIERVKIFNADLFLSMSFNQILKASILSVPHRGFINCHAGKLPFYRGRNPLNWALINDEKEFGITVHFIDEGIDTGDIIVQDIEHISDADDYASLLARAVEGCALSVEKAIKLLLADDFLPTKQSSIHPVGTYFGRRIAGDEFIDFNWSARRLFNFVRAITSPGPCARFNVCGEEFAIGRLELIPGAPEYISTIGEVIGRSERGNIVKVGDSTVLITSVATVRHGQAGNYECPKFKVGTRLIGVDNL